MHSTCVGFWKFNKAVWLSWSLLCFGESCCDLCSMSSSRAGNAGGLVNPCFFHTGQGVFIFCINHFSLPQQVLVSRQERQLRGCLEAEHPRTLCKQIKFALVATTAWLRCVGGREEVSPVISRYWKYCFCNPAFGFHLVAELCSFLLALHFWSNWVIDAGEEEEANKIGVNFSLWLFFFSPTSQLPLYFQRSKEDKIKLSV